MTERMETNVGSEKIEYKNFEGELDDLKLDVLSLNIKKDSFRAKQEIKDKIKDLGFYNGDENGEDIRFYITNVKKYLETIKNKTWSDLEVKSSALEKGVWTTAIQIAINYINKKNGETANNIELIDGILGNQTWKGVKEFQTTYKLKYIDGLPGRETISKILELLGNHIQDDEDITTNENTTGNNNTQSDTQSTNNLEDDIGEGNEIGTNAEHPRLNYDNIDDNKCFSLLENLKVDNGNEVQNLNMKDFEDKLKARLADMGKLESIVFKNTEIQYALNSILAHQQEDIEIMRNRYNQKNESLNESVTPQTNEELNENNEETVQSWDEYKYENYSINNFEDFILSDEGIAIIINEIKSHIDTNYENENGEYNKFYEKYPFSTANLEIRLKNEWESKLKSNYYNQIYDEEMDKLDNISSQITGNIDQIVGDHLKSDKEDFNQEIISSLQGLLSKGYNGVPYDVLYADKNQESAKNAFKGALSDKIKNYERLVRHGDIINLNTGNKQIDLQLKSYLYFYGSIFYPTLFNSEGDAKYYEKILPEVMMTILSNDDTSLTNKIVHKKFLEAEKKLEKEKREKELQRRKEIAKQNIEKNNRPRSAPKMEKGFSINESQAKSINPNNATGAEIASDLDLSGIKIEENNQFDEVNKEKIKYPAFDMAWKDFISSAGDVNINGQNVSIKSLITHIDMRKIYNIDTDTIDEDTLTRILSRIYKKPDGNSDISKEEISAVKEKLRGFSSQFKEHIKKLSNKSGEMKDKVQNVVKTHAMGSVIDNIRGIMSEIQNDSKNGFKLTQEPPVKIEGDYLILPGEMNGTKIDVRYNIETGDLFMNTLITQQGNDTIIIGENGNYKKVGELKNFSNIMNEYYKPEPIDTPEEIETNNYKPINATNFPKNIDSNHFHAPIHTNRREREREKRAQRKECFRETLNQDVQLIGEKIKNEFEKKELINSTITKFMKTFNIIPNEGNYKNIQIKEGCSLFNLFQTISQSTSSDLKAFEKYIKKITEFACIKRGENEKYPDITKLIEKEYPPGIKKDIKDSMLAYNSGEKIKPEDEKVLFDESFKSSIINTIIKYCISGEAPNQKIDTNKIKESLNDLNQRDEEVSIENMRNFT